MVRLVPPRHCRRRTSTGPWTNSGSALRTAVSPPGPTSPVVGSEPEEDVLDDEAAVDTEFVTEADVGEGEERLRDVPLPLADLPGGVHIGTFIHRVLETTDFAAVSAEEELRARIESALAWRRIDLGDLDAWVAGLATMIETPLGPIVDDMALTEFGPGDRLDEIGFELPLVGGETPSGDLSVSDIADVLRTPPGYRRHPRRVRGPPRRPLARPDPAWLPHGQPGPGAPAARVIASPSSTTRPTGSAARPGTAANAWHYRPSTLTVEMYRAHYPLQALLYSVAFTATCGGGSRATTRRTSSPASSTCSSRGMSSPQFPKVGSQPCGVWGWGPPAGLVEIAQRPLRARWRQMSLPVLDPYDVGLATRAGGVRCRTFNEAGVLRAADVHVARRLGALTGTDDDAVLLAAALAVRCPRLGHVCVDLTTIASTASTETEEQVDLHALPWPGAEEWLDRLRISPLVGEDRPLRLEGARLYLDRYWSAECRVAADLLARADRQVDGVDPAVLRRGLDALFFGDEEPDLQRPRRRVRRPAGRVGHRRWPRNGQDDHGCPRPGAPGRAGVRRRAAPAPGRPGRAYRQGGGPTGGGGQTRRAGAFRSQRSNGIASSYSEARRCTDCWAGARTTPGSVTTGSTGSLTTWSSSTRPPWSRSRSWPASSRPCARTVA